MSISLFNGPLTNAFQPTAGFLLAGETVVLDLVANVASVPPAADAGRIECYLEYTTEDPNAVNTRWFREVAEEDIGNGDVRMPKVVRRFTENGADTALAVGIHYLNMQFSRKEGFARLQVRVAAGGANACSLAVFAVFGALPLSAP
jgi:hypothetical protein